MRAGFWLSRWWIIPLAVLAAGVLVVSLLKVPFAAVGDALSHLGAGQIVVLALVNLAILMGMTARWWLVLRGLGWRVPFAALLAYRLSGFGVSYFTPGPQFGGEPVQVHLLHRRSAVPLADAVSSVMADRVVDLLANFTFLAVGAVVLVFNGVSSTAWIFALLLLSLPVAHMAALWRGHQPAASLAGWVLRRARWSWLAKAAGITRQAELQVFALLREQPLVLVQMVSLSVVTWAAMVFEFWLLLGFLGVAAAPVEVISALTAARLAFLMPLPGGLGALEASQIAAAQLLGWPAAVGVAASLVIRARDVFLAVLGIWFSGYAYRMMLVKVPVTEERSA